ncbi:hypothetical protein [Bacillus cereus]|uniref:hypothetical protein n=1 Tax=Bacillus cereus TaxID=1396 RepID=UPI000BF4C35C|nr:hypothetical protein [Bacillus cereus]PFV15868.1 hypothetical protein COK96_24680 [Bacillus cereus]
MELKVNLEFKSVPMEPFRNSNEQLEEEKSKKIENQKFIQKLEYEHKMLKIGAVAKYSLLVFLMTVVLVLLVSIYIPSLWSNHEATSNLYGLGKNITDVLRFILPVTITIYTFSYRESKQIAPSNIGSMREKKQLNMFIIFSISTFGLGMIIHSLGVAYSWLLLIWYMQVVISIYLLAMLLKNSFQNINIAKLSEGTIDLTNDSIRNLKKLMSIWDGLEKNRVSRLIEKQEERAHAHIESTYQNLKYTNEKNMYSMFDENLKKLEKTLKVFNNQDFFDLDKTGYVYIPDEKIEIYKRLYKTILSNQVKLIVDLFNENKMIKGQEALRILTQLLYPKFNNNVLHQCYRIELYHLTSNFKLDDIHKFTPLLKALNQMEKEKIEKVYQNLIIRAVESGDVKFLCSIVYLATKEDDQGNKKEKIAPKQIVVAKALKRKIIQKDVHLILKAILKSIELGHNACAGFLIKFLVTRFRGLDIRISLSNFSKTNANVVLDFTENEQQTTEETDIQRIDFNFNSETFDYCYYKMAILIYGQQVFAKKNSLPIKNIHPLQEYVEISKAIGECAYSKYLFEKILKANSSYGLLFVTQVDFMNSLQRKIKWEMLKK